MKRAARRWFLVAPLLLGGAHASAWDSECYVHPPGSPPDPGRSNPPCLPGPPTARERWIGANDEHRQIFVRSCTLAGLPASLCSGDVSVQVFTRNDTVATRAGHLPTYVPASFESTERAVTRTWQIAELSQLADFGYALWDWAQGFEACPIPGEGETSVEACHSFKSHMGAVNSNHFLPQAAHFYTYYHDLALRRAAACADMVTRLRADRTVPARFADFVSACEAEALSIEATGQHFLQDSWSMGHMWQRWGSPDLADFPADNRRGRAVLIGVGAGLIHGARGVAQDELVRLLPASVMPDCNDALCAPHAQVAWVGAVTPSPNHAVGDLYLSDLVPRNASYPMQYDRMFGCAAAGIAAVYRATGHPDSDLRPSPELAGLSGLDPTLVDGPCFAQRASNTAFLHGAGLDVRLRGEQLHFELDGFFATRALPVLASMTTGPAMITVTPALQNEFRDDLAIVASWARVTARLAPNATDAANLPSTFLGMLPNGSYLHAGRLATYVEPALPWPATTTEDPGDGTTSPRALALARMFHRAHAADWCAETTSAQLEALRNHARDPALDEQGRTAALDACAEIVARHLRVGSESSYDRAREPLCNYLSGSGPTAYVYQAALGDADTPALARAWCGRVAVNGIAAGHAHTCALRASGTVACWGDGHRLGDGTVTHRSTPVAVSGLSGAVEITTNYFHTCARRASGTVVCWGDNTFGQLGDGTVGILRSTPVAVSGLSDAVEIDAGERHTCARRASGTVVCWGLGDNGQLGDGMMTTRLTPVAVMGL